MAVITNQIGEFFFFDLQGLPDGVKSKVGVMARAGVDGLTLIDDGKRGEPFPLRSRVDAEEYQIGLQAFDAYCELIGGDPVEIVYQDQSISASGLLFAVLDVKLAVLKPIRFAVGGLNPPSLAWLECDWMLVPLLID